MENLKGWQKYLKIVSIIVIIVDIACLAIDIFITAGSSSELTSGVVISAGSLPEGLPVSADAVVSVGAGSMIVYYAIALLVAIVVLIGAMNPSRIMPGLVLCVIATVISVLVLAGSIVSSGSVLSAVSRLIFDALMLYGCVKVNQLRKMPL